MIKTKILLNKTLTFFLSLLIITGLTDLSTFSISVSNQNVFHEDSNIVWNTNESGNFALTDFDVEITDDYHPESAYISEVEASIYYSIEESNDISTAFSIEMPKVLTASSTIPGDTMVYYTQKWLNQEYGSVSGFGSVPEDGKTGWDTIYGLLRALQYELGITSLANSFGPNTSSRYEQNILRRNDGVIDRKYAILQGALWCKGYSSGYGKLREENGKIVFDEVFDAEVEAAVKQLKQDAGLSNPNGDVSLNVMKALMSMDSFKLLPSAYGSDPIVRNFQQKLNRKYEAYIGLNPCDGVYGRNTNKAIILALQAEEGLPINDSGNGVYANGNFGNTTRKCCPELPYARNSIAAKMHNTNTYYSGAQIASITELLEFSLYVNGYGNGDIDGYFNAYTQQNLRDFQTQHAIPITGRADKGTWMSLFISCGDINRSAIAADCATILTAAKAKTLYDNDYRYIGRYLTGTYGGGISKALTKTEAQIILNAGLNFFPIYQDGQYVPHDPNAYTYFTEAKGISDAEKAISVARALGIPTGTTIYFAVDFDALDSHISSHIIPYFRGVSSQMDNNVYKTGVYGTRNVCNRISDLGYATTSFVADMSTGWSGNLGFKIPDNWAFDQFADTITIGNGIGELQIDKNGFSGRDYGVSKLEKAENLPNIPNISGDNFSVESQGEDTLEGPTVNILGNEIPLFSTEIGFELPNDISIQTEYDEINEELQVIIGMDIQKYEQEISGVSERPYRGAFREAYREVRTTISSLGQSNRTITDNSYSYREAIERGSAYDRGLKVGFESNVSIMGYMSLSLKTGKPVLTSGEIGFIGSVSKEVKYPFVPPSIYAKFKIEGSIEAGFKLVEQQSGIYSLGGHINLAVKPSLSVGLDIIVASAYAGISGQLEGELLFGPDIKTFEEAFTATFSAAVFFEYNALFWGNSWEWTFAQLKLYPPEFKQRSLSISTDDLEFIQPLPQIMSLQINESDVFKQNMQVYSKPQIINLNDENMFMVYIDDTTNRTAENRSILMYSVFNGTSWSSPKSVSDDGTADFEPSIYSDGKGGVHIVWQNATAKFNANVTLEEMSSNMDLQYIHWNGSAFDNNTTITNANQNIETQHKVVSSENNISIVWIQNSENDSFGFSGTNSIHRKQFAGGSWKNTETLATGLQFISSIDSDYNGSTNIVAYTTKKGTDLSTIDDLEVFYINGTTKTQITNDNIPDYSINLNGNELYWVSGDSIVTMTMGSSKKTILDNANTSKIKVVYNENDDKSIIWEQSSDFDTLLYYTNYNKSTGIFDTAKPLNHNKGVIRGWDACILSNGQVETTYCFAESLETPVDGKPYGRLDLIQKSADKFYDISVNPISRYDGEIKPGEKISVFSEVYNSGSLPVSQFDVKVYNGNSTVKSQVISQNLSVGESGVIEITLTLPSSIARTDYRIEVLPRGNTDIFLEDNESIFSFGFADLTIDKVEKSLTTTGRQMKITIKNQGFNTINSAKLNILEESNYGTVLESYNISKLVAGDSTTISYNISEKDLDFTISETPNLYFLSVETDEDESDYGNNDESIAVHPNYTLTIKVNTGGTVEGAGTFEKNSIVSVIAKPASGYIFDGWYENGEKIHMAQQNYEITVDSNRTIEAKFKRNDLVITSLEAFGAPYSGELLTFTAFTQGGIQPLQYTFNIYQNGVICDSSDDNLFNFFEWVVMEDADYTIEASVTDATGRTVKRTSTIKINSTSSNGDVNADGFTDVFDMMLIRGHINGNIDLKKITPAGAFERADIASKSGVVDINDLIYLQKFLLNNMPSGDVNGDGFVNSIDVLMLRSHLGGIKTLDSDSLERVDIAPKFGEIDIDDLNKLIDFVIGR